MDQLRIGCAGWSLAKQVADDFPADGSHLQRYAAVFNAVEINSSFYRPHQPKTYARWAGSVPEDFRFSVKLPRAITHECRLADSAGPLARFAAEANALGAKLGCVLVQLPPSLRCDPEVADDFFTRARAAFGCTIACEARHASWFDADASALLRHHGVARVRADPPAGQPGAHEPTASTAYVRLHGSPRTYYSSYSGHYLHQLASELAQQHAWCIFDNTAAGAAIPNALDLMRLLRGV